MRNETLGSNSGAARVEEETVGELTKRNIDNEERAAKHFDYLRAIFSTVAAGVGVAAITQDSLVWGGNALAIVAVTVGIGVMSAAFLIADSVGRRSLPDDPQPLASSLESLQSELAAMRRPLLKRSRADTQER